MHLDTEFAAATLQDQQQLHPAAAAESVTGGPDGFAVKHEIDLVPIGELRGDVLISLLVVGVEVIEGFVGKHHAEAEGIVRTIALMDVDRMARPRLLRQYREVEPRRPASDDDNPHRSLPRR